jgi:hypothetical protein
MAPKQRKIARSEHGLQTRVYAFGALRPAPEHEALLVEQLKLLVEYKRRRALSIARCRRAIEEARIDAFPDYAEASKTAEWLGTQIAGLYEELSRERQRARKRLRVPEVERAIAELKAQRVAAWAAQKAARKAITETHKPAHAALKERFAAAVTAARAEKNSRVKERLRAELEEEMLAEDWPESWKAELRAKQQKLTEEKRIGREIALWSTTKDWARADVRAAEAKTDSHGGRVAWPRSLEGRLGVVPKLAVVAEDGSVSSQHFSLEFDAAFPPGTSRRSQLRRKMIAALRCSPDVTIPLRVLAHRRMPAGAKIARAWIQVRSVAGRLQYRLQIAVQADSFARANAKRHEHVSVELGWTRQPDGSIRSAVWTGNDGSTGEMAIDARTVESFAICDRLQGHREDHFNRVRRVARLYARITANEELATACKSKSPRQLEELAQRWWIGKSEQQWQAWKQHCATRGLDLFPNGSECIREIRRCFPELSGDACFVRYLEFWRRKHLHLRRYEANSRLTAIRRRLDYYRRMAHDLAGRYAEFSIQNPPHAAKKAAKKTPPEGDVKGNEQAVTRQRRIAATSVLQGALKNAFR